MTQTLNFVQEKKMMNLEYIQSENIYSHDNIFFSPMEKNESWSFLLQQDFSSTGLSFLFIRSLIASELFGQKIQVIDLNQSMKARIAKLGFASLFNKFLETNPILTMPEKEVSPISISEMFVEEKSFHIIEEDKKGILYTGGGILKERKTNAHEMVEKLFTEFNLRDKTGHFFLRTKSNSYLYLLNPENKSKTFYIQQKNTFTVDFQFYHIKTYT